MSIFMNLINSHYNESMLLYGSVYYRIIIHSFTPFQRTRSYRTLASYVSSLTAHNCEVIDISMRPVGCNLETGEKAVPKISNKYEICI